MALPEFERRRRMALTPLIDAVFILLLFFMVATTFSRHGFYEVSLGAGSPAAQTPLQDAMLLTVGAGGRLVLNGLAMDEAQLVEFLHQQARQRSLRLVLRTQGQASTQHMMRAVDLARSAGVSAVALGAE